jgi:hypothetical protein
VNTPIVNYNRTFQMWSFTVGHGQLLIRSTKSEAHSTRVDILFKNVKSVYLPTLLNDLSISKVQDATVITQLILQMPEFEVDDVNVYEVAGKNYKGFVVAGFCGWHEDDKEYNEPSAFLIMT